MERNCYAGVTSGMTAQAMLYDADGRDAAVGVDRALIEGLKPDQLLWIDIDPNDGPACAEVVAALAIEPKVIARVTDRDRPPYLDNYPETFAFAIAAPEPEEGSPLGLRLGFVVGKQWLLTLHSRPIDYISDFKAQDKGETLIGRLSPAMLTAALLDWHLTRYFHEVADIEAAVDELDEKLLSEGAERKVLDDIVRIRARVSRLRAQLARQRPIFYGFERSDFALNFEHDEGELFARLSKRYDRAIDEVERTRDVVVGSFELFTSMTTQQTNDLVKALTFLTAVIGICAAVAGLLGMNFDIPIFKTGMHGFEIVTGSLLVFAVLSLIVAKFRRWF